MNTQYLQLAIDGIAENKDFNDALGIPTREIKRVKLAEFIRYKLQTNKRGFARVAGVSPATVTKWLYSDTEPGIEMSKKLARRFGLSLDEVYNLFE